MNSIRESGIDTIEVKIQSSLPKALEISLKGRIDLHNEEGIPYGNIFTNKGGLKNSGGGFINLSFNMPKAIGRGTNVMPFTISDSIRHEMIGGTIYKDIKRELGISDSENISSRVSNVEINVTTEVDIGTTCHKVIDLFIQSIATKKSKQEKVFVHGEIDKRTNTVKKVYHGLFSRKLKTMEGGEYYVKIYDKDYEQWYKNNRGKKANLPEENKRKIRIEILMEDSLLKKLFNSKELTVESITKPKAVEILCNEYKRILEEEIFENHIQKFIQDTIKHCLVPHLLEHGSYVKAYTEFKEKIVDESMMKEALVKYYNIQKSTGWLSSNARISVYVAKAMKYLRDNHHIDELNGTLKTIENAIQRA